MSYYGPRSSGHKRSNGDRRAGGGRSNGGGRQDNRSVSSSNHQRYNHGNSRHPNTIQNDAPRNCGPPQQELPVNPHSNGGGRQDDRYPRGRNNDTRNHYNNNNSNYDNYGNYNRQQHSNQHNALRTRDPQQQESPFKPPEGAQSNRGGRQDNGFSRGNNDTRNHYNNNNNYDNYENYNMQQHSNQHNDPRTRDLKQQETPSKPHDSDDDEKVSSVQPISHEQQEHRKKQKLLKVTAENWDSCTFEEKARSQFWMDHNAIFSMEGLTADEDTRHARALGENWFAKKKEAARIAWKRVDEIIIDVSEKEFGKPIASDDYEDMDSDDSSVGRHQGLFADLHDSIVDEAEGVKPFIDALPYCVYLDQGFHYNGVSSAGDEMCYCPCGKKLKNWRDNFKLSDNEGCDDKKKRAPKGLMDHLRKLAEGERCFRHLGTLIYLEELYKNYWGTIKPNIDHKDLYDKESPNYKAAIQAERIEFNEAMSYLQRANRENQRILKEQQKKLEEAKELKAINEDLSNKQKELEEKLKKNNIKLGIATKRKETKDFSKEEIFCFRKNIFDNINEKKRRIIKDGREQKFELSQDIDFQKLFDSWNENSKAGNDVGALFKDFTSEKGTYESAIKVVRNWDVQFHSGTKKKINENTAIDDGGPSRVLYNAFFEQVVHMKIYFKVLNDTRYGRDGRMVSMIVKKGFKVCCPDYGEYGEGVVVENNIKDEDNNVTDNHMVKFENIKSPIVVERNQITVSQVCVNLFDDFKSNSKVLIPASDSVFEVYHHRFLEHYSNVQCTDVYSKARRYYRAVGRFLAHVIFDDRNCTISSTILPVLLQNLFLRGLETTSPLYKMEDLSGDLHQMDESFSLDSRKNQTFRANAIDNELIEKYYPQKYAQNIIDEGSEVNKDNFREFADLYILRPRSIAIEGLDEGINLRRPALEKGTLTRNDPDIRIFPVIFSIIPSALLNSFLFSCPKYDIEQIIVLLQQSHDEFELSIAQITFITDTLPNVLRRLANEDEAFPANFMLYVTGSAILPHIESNPDFKIMVGFQTSLTEQHLPQGHTCVKQINFPDNCYDPEGLGISESVLEEKLKSAISIVRIAGFGLV